LIFRECPKSSRKRSQQTEKGLSSEENIALVLTLFEKFDRGELNQFTMFVDEAFVANVLGITTLDWEGFMQFGNGFLSAFPDGRHVFEYVVADGENVVTVGTYQGTHKGYMQGIPPTNMELKLPLMHLDRVVNGKIVEHLGLANEVDLMKQLGISLVPEERS
jgi:predicted ester cyclase